MPLQIGQRPDQGFAEPLYQEQIGIADRKLFRTAARLLSSSQLIGVGLKLGTRLYWRRGWRLFFAPSHVVRNLSRLAALFAVNIVAQRFIEKRSPLRWAAH